MTDQFHAWSFQFSHLRVEKGNQSLLERFLFDDYYDQDLDFSCTCMLHQNSTLDFTGHDRLYGAQHINSKNECMLELMGPFEVETKHKFQMDVDFVEFCSFKPFHWNNWIGRTAHSTYINRAVLFPIRHNVAVLCCTMPCHTMLPDSISHTCYITRHHDSCRTIWRWTVFIFSKN